MVVLRIGRNVHRYSVNIESRSRNMNCSPESMSVVRPGTARVTVTELAASSETNPTPMVNEDCELLLEPTFSPDMLRALTGCKDLQEVTTLEMSIDTREHSLGSLGTYLPSLVQLRLSNSLISSVRDLGTTLSHLQVLWMPRCGLADLDGIISFSSLKELYVAYNNIADLSQVSMLECLELLDLEGNNVDDLVQVQYLSLCTQLRSLTLEGNPVCMGPHPGAEQSASYCYRSAVKKMLPQLHYLDDISVEKTGPHYVSASLEDWALLKESIKNSVLDSLVMPEKSGAVGTAACRPSSAPCPSTRSTGRPGTARSISSSKSRPGSADSDSTSVDPDASDLTHGLGRVICGNPVQALCARRQNRRLPATPSCTTPNPEQEHHLELSLELRDDVQDEDDHACTDVLAELRAWRAEHNKRIIAIERDRRPQVMKVYHNDTGQVEEEECRGSSPSSVSEEENEERERARLCSSHRGNIDSSDSCFQSPDFDMESSVPSPDVSQSSMSSDSGMSPSPPLILSPPKSGRGGPSETRAKRLRLKVLSTDVVKQVSIRGPRATGTGLQKEVLTGRSRIHPDQIPCNAPHPRPTSGPAVLGHRNTMQQDSGDL